MFKQTACLALLVASTHGKTMNATKKMTNITGSQNGVCSLLYNDLPSECQCQEGDYGQFQIYCTIDLLDVDEINFTANFQPCADEAEADFEVVEEDAGINYQTSYRGGEAETFPVPGLTVGIPVVGDANVVIAADIEGNLSELQVHIGLDACMTVWGYQKCGSSLTSELPYYVIDESYDFSNYCSGGKYFKKKN